MLTTVPGHIQHPWDDFTNMQFRFCGSWLMDFFSFQCAGCQDFLREADDSPVERYVDSDGRAYGLCWRCRRSQVWRWLSGRPIGIQKFCRTCEGVGTLYSDEVKAAILAERRRAIWGVGWGTGGVVCHIDWVGTACPDCRGYRLTPARQINACRDYNDPTTHREERCSGCGWGGWIEVGRIATFDTQPRPTHLCWTCQADLLRWIIEGHPEPSWRRQIQPMAVGPVGGTVDG